MFAAQVKADGVAKLLIDAGANLDVQNMVRPVGMHVHMHGRWLVGGRAGRAVSIIAACMHAYTETQ